MAQMINLLPWRRQQQQACRRFWGRFLVAGVSVMVLAAVILHVMSGLDRQIATLWHQSNAQLLSALTAKKPHFQALRQLWKDQQAKALRQQMTRDWQQRLGNLAEKMPDDAWLTEIHFQQERLNVSGLARSYPSLNALEQALGTMSGFHLSQTGATERDTQGRWQFHYQLLKDGDYAAQP